MSQCSLHRGPQVSVSLGRAVFSPAPRLRDRSSAPSSSGRGFAQSESKDLGLPYRRHRDRCQLLAGCAPPCCPAPSPWLASSRQHHLVSPMASGFSALTLIQGILGAAAPALPNSHCPVQRFTGYATGHLWVCFFGSHAQPRCHRFWLWKVGWDEAAPNLSGRSAVFPRGAGMTHRSAPPGRDKLHNLPINWETSRNHV